MRKAKYSAKKVYLPNASRLGYGLSYAKPGNWIVYTEHHEEIGTGKPSEHSRMARVLGRIDHDDHMAGSTLEDCAGFLAVMALADSGTHAYPRWVNPVDVTECYEKPPRALLEWLTGDDWPQRGADVGRVLAMAQHGTCSESYIASRNDPAKAYNARPEYVSQFTLE